MRSISGIIPSPDQRGSLAAASRKSRKAMALVVCEGPVGHDDRRRVGRGAVARGVADGAGLGDAREAHGLLGEADRELAALLPGDAEGAVAAGAGQEVAEDPRQHVEDRVGDAEVLLGAERAVLEALLLRARRRARRGARARRRRRPPAAGCGRPCTRRRRRRRRRGRRRTAAMRATLYQGPASGLAMACFPQKVLRCSISARLSAGGSVGAPEVAAVAVAAAGAGVAGAVHRRRRRPGRAAAASARVT